jgi:vitamin B12 transporter
MKKEKKVWAITLIAFWWLAPNHTNAQQDSVRTITLSEVVIIGTKFELPVEQSGKVIFRLNEQQLAQQQGRTVGELLNNIPSMQVDGIYSAPGANISYYIRGSRNRQTLVLLDGVPMSDPTGIDLFFDLRFAPLDQFENIEVFQGGLSTLYGTGATAAVINLQSKTPAKGGIHGQLGTTLGNWNSLGQNIQVGGTKGKISFQLLGSNYATNGFSAALDEAGNQNFDDDGLERKNLNLNIGYQINKSIRIKAFGGIDAFDTDFDGGAFVDNADRLEQQQVRLGVRSDVFYRKGEINFLAQYTDIQRDFFGSFPQAYEGSTFFGELSHRHQVTEEVTLLSGLTTQQLEYDTLAFTIVDPYTSVLFSFSNGINLHAGLRLNTHSEYGSKALYNINPSWLAFFNEQVKLKLFSSVSTAFITPSLFQLYNPYGGNAELKPEETLNYEFGLTFYWSSKLTFSAVNFYRNEKNTIGYTTAYENLVDKQKIDGFTFSAHYSINKQINILVDHSYTATNKPATFYRIPKQKTAIAMEIKAFKGSFMTASYAYTSERTDLYYDANFNANQVNLPSYALVDFTISQNFLKDAFAVRATVNNLINKDFIGVYGFTTRGRNYTVGLSYRF